MPHYLDRKVGDNAARRRALGILSCSASVPRDLFVRSLNFIGVLAFHILMVLVLRCTTSLLPYFSAINLRAGSFSFPVNSWMIRLDVSSQGS